MDTHSESATPAKSVRLGRSVALLLSLLGAGSGHVVIGHSKRGLRWLASVVLAVLGLVTLVIAGPRLFGWVFAIITVGLRVGAIVDVLWLPIRATGSSRLHTILMVPAMLAASGLIGVATLRLINAVRQPSVGMYPTIEEGDHFITTSVLGRLERGDVIIFDYPLDRSARYVKRIVGLAGDVVEIRGGRVILNKKPVHARSANEPCRTAVPCTIWHETLDGKTYRISMVNDEHPVEPMGREFGPKLIPEGELFVLGDNRDNSADSRYWGNVPIELVRGKPKFIYWSSGASGIRWNRINRAIE